MLTLYSGVALFGALRLGKLSPSMSAVLQILCQKKVRTWGRIMMKWSDIWTSSVIPAASLETHILAKRESILKSRTRKWLLSSGAVRAHLGDSFTFRTTSNSELKTWRISGICLASKLNPDSKGRIKQDRLDKYGYML